MPLNDLWKTLSPSNGKFVKSSHPVEFRTFVAELDDIRRVV